MTVLRAYQEEAQGSVLAYWAAGGGSPLVEMATGLGKSVVIATLVRLLAESYPVRILVLVHVKELVEQNFMALHRLWPQAPAGIYAAGLGQRVAHRRITFGSIQSLYNKAELLGDIDVVIIDETHLVPKAGAGMYRTLLDALRERVPDMRVCGFTATAFRMGEGRLDEGDDRLFDETVYSYGVGDGIADGWLSPLIAPSRTTSGDALIQVDVSKVAKRGGEFVAGALEAAFDVDELTKAAIAQCLDLGRDRKSWLVFCSGVKHAFHVRDALRLAGVSAETITGDTDARERARTISEFKAGRIRALTNANVLTTGFDAPGVDMLVMLRSTLSVGLYIQMAGRGTRLAPGKKDCLVADYAGNVRRHGPVDAIEPPNRKKGTAGVAVAVNEVRAKECDSCGSLVAIQARTCPHCGADLAGTPDHEDTADTTPILAGKKVPGIPDEVAVSSWSAERYRKQGSPDSLRVTYFAGVMIYNEWVALEHDSSPGHKARKWWRHHGGQVPEPVDVTAAIERFKELTQPAAIFVRKDGKYWDVMGSRMPGAPEPREQAA